MHVRRRVVLLGGKILFEYPLNYAPIVYKIFSCARVCTWSGAVYIYYDIDLSYHWAAKTCDVDEQAAVSTGDKRQCLTI